jgi:sulfofructosephosphate aldolase
MDPEQRSRLFQSLARPGGGFAMVANDGRETLRGMLDKAGKDTGDEAMRDFKTAVANHLGPHCSAMLVDLMYGEPALAELRTAAPGTGRIVSVDLFDEPRFGGLAATSLDRPGMSRDAVPSDVHALKFFMFWHPDQPVGPRREEAAAFVEGCAALGVLSLLEGVVQLPATDPRFDDSLLAAAAELGDAHPDLYKTQVPTLGRESLAEIERRSAELTRAVRAPWVALSNGVAADAFADVVGAVCRGGASGFLAGRASWSRAVEAADPGDELASSGVARLTSFAERVDRDAVPWWVASGLPSPHTADMGADRVS